VVWTRLFVVVIGNTVFSVSAILGVFMAGLALGSRLAGRIIDRQPLPLVRTYAALEAGVALYNLVLPLLLKAANPLFGALYGAAVDSFWLLTMGRLLIALVLLIVPATLMGIESNGMVLAASHEGALALVAPDKELPSGAKVR